MTLVTVSINPHKGHSSKAEAVSITLQASNLGKCDSWGYSIDIPQIGAETKFILGLYHNFWGCIIFLGLFQRGNRGNRM